MQDVSGFGLIVSLVADETFPAGIVLTQFADDADPLDMASIQIADKAMSLNGELVTWAKAVPVPAILNIIPGSADDENLSILAQNNRPGLGKIVAGDKITMTVKYPNGTVTFLTGGVMTDAMFGKSVSSAGRQKSKTYTFAFEQVVAG